MDDHMFRNPSNIHAVFHSVINNTGATRYLLNEILPTLEAHELVLWWREMTQPQPQEAMNSLHYLRNSKREGFLVRSRLIIFVLQILYLIHYRHQLSAVTINSISNLGAVIGCLFLRRDTDITVFIHERPRGKWLLAIGVLRWMKRASIVTVSPYNKTELEAAGLKARWIYPKAFFTDLTLSQSELPARSAGWNGLMIETVPDIVIVAHPDGSKGFALLRRLLKSLSRDLRITLYLSRPASDNLQPPPNVEIHVGQSLKQHHYKARLTVITSDPIQVKETFSYITAESLAAGTPVLCFPSGGISEQLIHGVNGHFVEDYTVAAFKAAIDRLFGDPGQHESLRSGVAAVNAHKYRYLT